MDDQGTPFRLKMGRYKDAAGHEMTSRSLRALRSVLCDIHTDWPAQDHLQQLVAIV